LLRSHGIGIRVSVPSAAQQSQTPNQENDSLHQADRLSYPCSGVTCNFTAIPSRNTTHVGRTEEIAADGSDFYRHDLQPQSEHFSIKILTANR